MKIGSRARLRVSSVATHLRTRHPFDSSRDHSVNQCPTRSSRPESVRSPTRSYRMSMWTDRKSTRLNSSHSQISYAVFCLKKKKKENRKISKHIHPTAEI